MPKNQRRDLFAECNQDGAPIDVFQEGCCSRCFNLECTRSQFGKAKFDQRVNTWEDRLFLAVPRMDSNDPRYPTISCQKFLTLDTSRTPELNSADWVDPADPPPPPAAPSPESSAIPDQVKVAPARGKLSPSMALANTPVRTGLMVEPSPSSPSSSAPQKDPWATPAAPAPSSENAKVVKPGATIKLGGSGV